MGNNVRFAVQATGIGKASSEMDHLRDKFDKLQKQGAKGFAIGIAAGATSFALGAMSQAVSQVTDVIGDSIKAALEDEASIQRLGSSLKANIPNWDGNTSAIERVAKASIKLGFADEDTRNSIALLVGATHDVNKALAIEATAMDLARFKRISLAEATQALVSIDAGRARGLAALGINVKDFSTIEERLTAVQRVAAGQAADYARTNEGRLLVSQTKVTESMEKFGYVVMPAVIDSVSGAADAVTGFASTVDVLQGKLPKTQDEIQTTEQGIVDLTRSVAVLLPGMGLLADTAESSMTKFAATTDTAMGKAADDLAGVDRALDKVGDHADGMASDAARAFGRMVKAADSAKTDMLADAQSLVDDYYGAIVDADKLAATNAEIAAAKRVLASKTASDAEKHDARVTLHQLEADRAKMMQDLAAAGGSSSKVFKDTMKGMLGELAKAHGKERAAIWAEITALGILAAKAFEASKRVAQLPSSFFHGPGGTGADRNRAIGGPIAAGEVYQVGEHGPETFVSDKAGRIIPHGPGASSAGAMGGVNFNVTINAGAGSGLTPGGAREFVQAVGPALYADMRRQGFLPRTATGLTG